jgi:hypothetical protein
MAKKEDRKKQKKRLRDKKKDSRQRQHLASQRPSPFPDIVINADCEDPVFRKVVAEVVADFSYTDDTHCPPDIRDHYSVIAMIGWREWYASLKAKMYSEHVFRVPAERALQGVTVPVFLHFGTWVFQHLPPQYTARFDPAHFFRVDQYRNVLLVSFTLMEYVRDNGQRLYIPQREPTMSMQGVDWKIGLYPHALERLCSRLVPQSALTYSNCVDVFYRFDRGILQFVPTSFADGSVAARVDFTPPLGTVFYEEYAAWVRTVLELPETHDFAEDGWWSIVLGYLPLHVQGKYARAKTFLLPGFSKTPEHVAGCSRANSIPEHALIAAMMDEDNRTYDLTGDVVEAVRWFQSIGVPQIFRGNGRVTPQADA